MTIENKIEKPKEVPTPTEIRRECRGDRCDRIRARREFETAMKGLALVKGLY